MISSEDKEVLEITASLLPNFRCVFCLNMLRAGIDIHSLAALMGHADIQVLRRYLAQTEQDIQAAYRRGIPVDISLK